MLESRDGNRNTTFSRTISSCSRLLVELNVKRLSYISFGEEQRHIRTVTDAMTSMPLTVGPKAYISAAAGLMLKHKIHRLPVVEEGEDYAHPGKLIGIITLRRHRRRISS